MNRRVLKWKTFNRARGAFTLIELLVVIAIMAILAGLLLPVLGRAKAKAQATVCLNHVRQWSLAIIMYADDCDDYLPYEGNPTRIDTGKNLQAWFNVLSPYFNSPRLMDLYATGKPPLPGNRSVFACPNTTQTPTNTPTAQRAFFMYGFNSRLDPDDTGPVWLQFRCSQVKQPSSTIDFTENSESYYPVTSGRFAPARHARRANLGFVDGHAEAVHTNDYCRTLAEDTNGHDKTAASKLEWSKPRKVYWFPYSGAPE